MIMEIGALWDLPKGYLPWRGGPGTANRKPFEIRTIDSEA